MAKKTSRRKSRKMSEYNKFVQKCMKQDGLNMAQAAAAWAALTVRVAPAHASRRRRLGRRRGGVAGTAAGGARARAGRNDL